MEVILRKRGNSLIPVDDQGRELLAKLRDGRDVGCDIIQRRNPRHHRLFYQIVQFVRMHAVDRDGNNLFENADTETITDAIKIATGYVKRYIDMDTGETWGRPLSISWGAMDQTRFNAFFDKACATIAQRWMPPGTVAEDVRRELIEMVDGPHALSKRVA